MARLGDRLSISNSTGRFDLSFISYDRALVWASFPPWGKGSMASFDRIESGTEWTVTKGYEGHCLIDRLKQDRRREKPDEIYHAKDLARVAKAITRWIERNPGLFKERTREALETKSRVTYGAWYQSGRRPSGITGIGVYLEKLRVHAARRHHWCTVYGESLLGKTAAQYAQAIAAADSVIENPGSLRRTRDKATAELAEILGAVREDVVYSGKKIEPRFGRPDLLALSA